MKNMKKMTDNKKFGLAVFLCAAGVMLLFAGLFLPPAGTISTSVLGGAGEMFLTSGAILGVDAAYSAKLKEILKQVREETKTNDDATTIAKN